MFSLLSLITVFSLSVYTLDMQLIAFEFSRQTNNPGGATKIQQKGRSLSTLCTGSARRKQLSCYFPELWKEAPWAFLPAKFVQKEL